MKVEYINHMGGDDSVVKAARVSFAQDKEVREVGKDAKLIKFLAKHNHWTPFAHTSITLRVAAPIPIRTQCFKHKQGFVENEESRRYVSYEPSFFVPKFRLQASNKKQGSGAEVDEIAQAALEEMYLKSIKGSIDEYKFLLNCGVAEEQCRFLLPQGCIVNWYWTGSLSAFARFYKQRTNPNAQKEVQELAREVGDIVSKLYPISWEALIGEEID